MNILQKLPSLSRKQRKIALVTVGGIILLVLIGVGVGLSVRGKVLNKAMKRAEAVLLDRYNIDFKVRDVGFTGLATVTFQKIELLASDSDRVARIQQLPL